MKKKIVVLLMALLLVLTSCGKEVTKPQKSDDEKSNVELTLLYMSGMGDKDAPIIKDQLEKVGIKVNLVQTPDYATYREKQKAGDYDLVVSGWTTVTGNPDYAVGSLLLPDGAYNRAKVNDSVITEAILKARTQTADEYVKTYGELEQALMDKAYIIPLYSTNKSQAFNKKILVSNPENVRLPKSRAQAWEMFDYVNKEERATRAMVLSQQASNLTSLDPIRGNDGSINTINTNMYARLVNLTDDDKITTNGALSYNYAVMDNNKSYYFILKDNVNFGVLKDNKAVDTGELVAAEDVVFSLERAKNKDSVQDHRTYTLHSNMSEVSQVTDLKELETNKTAGGETLLEVLSKDLPTPISAIVSNKSEVDNKEGKYQIVKIETKEPFPQVLNFLAHQSAGILSEKQVKAVYDAGDVYGDEAKSSTDNHIYASGPYIMVSKDDQKVSFTKNPGYMAGTENEARIENVDVLFIADQTAAVQALFSGELYLLYNVPTLHHKKVESDEKLQLQTSESNACSYLQFNVNPEFKREVLDLNLRKAALNAVDPSAFINIVYNGKAVKLTSTVTPLIKNLPGYVEVSKPTDVEAAKKYLSEYIESKKTK